MEVKRRGGESTSAFLYRFSNKIRQSGILREAKKRKFHKRALSKQKKHLSALHRIKKQKEAEKARKLGII